MTQLKRQTKSVPERTRPANSVVPHAVLRRQCTCGNQSDDYKSTKCANNDETRGLQRKLLIGSSNDLLEGEADRVAEHVMASAPSVGNGSMPTIQRIAGGQHTGSLDTAPESVERILANPGRQLEPAIRQHMENRFGHDFSRVRVHSGESAERSARELNAHAYTVAHHIVFGNGRFTPDTYDGRKLLAHELTHVVQQSGLSHQRPLVARKDKENVPSKEAIEKSKKQRDAIALFWNDLKTNFPGEGRKLAGSGYDDTIDYLNTSFQEGETIADGVKTSRSAPMVYVGNKYFLEPDVDKRKTAIKAELDKIDQFRFDNARIDDDDLSNAVVTSKIGSLDIFGKRDYLKRLEAQKFIKNNKVKEYIRRLMPSTPLGPGAVATAEGGFEMQFENIKIVVKPDVFNSTAVAANEAHTEMKRIDSVTYKTKPGFNWNKNDKVSSMTFTPFVPQLIYKVETHYGPQSDPLNPSGYGVGKRPEDAADKNTSIRFHEGSHGNVFIDFIRSNISKNSFPLFAGKLGDDKDDFGKKVDSYEKKVLGFDQMIRDALDASEQQVDCVGKTIEQFHTEKGTTSKVTCKKP